MYVSRIGPGKWTSVAGGRQFAKTARLRAVCGCLCGVFILNSAVANARADVPIELVGQWGGATGAHAVPGAITVDGNRAYLGVGPRLAVLDISEPTHPREMGRSAVMRGLVEEIVLSGDYVYARAGSLYILDVSDPAAPSLVGEYAASVGGWAMNGFSVRGNYAYVGFEGQGNQLHVVDLSDPRSPELVHAMELIDPRKIIISESYAFVLAWPGVVILDLSNPTMPRETGHISRRPIDFAISGSHAYLIYDDPWMDIYDISNVEAPVKVGTFVNIFGGWPSWIDVRDGLAYLLGGDDITIVDVSDPADPKYVGGFSHTELPAFGGPFAWTGEYMLIPSTSGGISILDVSDPTAPVPAGSFELAEKVRHLGLSDGFVYASGRSPILHVIDVSVPADPRKVAEVRLEEPLSGVTIDGSIAYASAGAALHLISVANPTAPERLASVEMSDYITDVTIAGQYALVAMREDGVVILGVSDPKTPVQIGSYNEHGQLGSVSISGSAAFIFDYGGTFIRVLDIADPTAPFRMGSFTARFGGWNAMTIRGNRAYVAAGYQGISIINISDPIAPRWLGRHDTLWSARDVAILGDLAYVAVDFGGLEIVDVSRRRAPVLIGQHDTVHRASLVSVSGSYVFVADDAGGLLIFRVTIHGDANCDGQINALDIEPFLLALFDPASYSGDYPHCDSNNADINGDGQINAADIEPFIELLWEP